MSNALVAAVNRLPTPVAAGSLDAYIATVNQIPVLSAEEEQDLATRFRRDNDLGAAQALILPHLRFVVHIARSYTGYGLALGDLIQEGNIGLMKAVKRFDPAQGVRLVSFAVHWIRAEIHEFVLRNWRIVKVATTKAQRKLFFKLRGAKKHLGWLTPEETRSVARDLGVPPETVTEMESRLSGQDLAFDLGPDADEDEAYRAPAAFLEDKRPDPAQALEAQDTERRELERLEQAMERLDPRSRDIVQRRWLGDDKATLQELADEYRVSAERIRQIEKNAFRKLKAGIAA